MDFIIPKFIRLFSQALNPASKYSNRVEDKDELF